MLDNTELLRGRLSARKDPELRIEIMEKTMQVFYTPKSGSLMFDITDHDGRMMLKGFCDPSKQVHQVILENLKKGNYVLWLIDGADLIKYNFNY
jgi:hypothetical protein